jgi:hypothetical protein
VCALPAGTAGGVLLTASSDVLGAARVNANASLTFGLRVDPTLSVVRSSVAGGLAVQLTGSGFSPNAARMVVRFGAVSALVTSASETALTVLAPPLLTATVATTVAVSVIVLNTDNVTTAASVTLPAAFTYDPATAYTATVSAILPASGSRNTVVTITGTSFGNYSANHTVTMGGAPCNINATAWTTTRIVCSVGAAPAGAQRVLVMLAGRGLAKFSNAALPVTFTSLLSVTGVSQSSVGMGGGVTLTVTGSGFAASELGGSNIVALCNTNCTVTSAAYDSLNCTTAPLVTQPALTAFNTWSPDMMMATPFGVGVASSVAKAFDMNVETTFTSCALGIDYGAASKVVVYRVRNYPVFHKTAAMVGGSWHGSNDPASGWVLLTTLTRVDEGWNDVDLLNSAAAPEWRDPGNATAYRYVRFSFAMGAECVGMELDVVGTLVAAASDGVCAMNVTVAAAANATVFTGRSVPTTVSADPSLAVHYDLASTPFIVSVSPNNGTALGGTLVTLTGSGFPASATQDVTVSLNGVPCAVQSTSATAVTCRTGVRPSVMPMSIDMQVAGVGAALYNASTTYFRYLDRWSAPTTWKYNEPPLEGDTVIVPIGQTVLVDVSPPRLFLVLVSGELIFDRRDGEFGATYIVIYGGRMEVGTEAEPFLNHLNITLYGDRYDTIEIPEAGAKGIAVMTRHGMDPDGHGDTTMMAPQDTYAGMGGVMGTGVGSMGMTWMSMEGMGVLDVHGRPRARVWTTLNVTARAGTDILVMSENVDWEVGETLVVSSSSTNYDEAEEVVVAEVLGPRTLRVASPLSYTHETSWYPADQFGHSDVDMRCEVGLMTRNIKIRGDDTSESQLFGAQTMAVHGATYRVENAEVSQCGQGGLLGRYCLHMHMSGDRSDSYVRSNSVHHSFQRGTTIHATSYTNVKHNFYYFVRGHTVFVEDGVEMFNVIEGNLVVKTLKAHMSLEGDMKPASFWTASPTNFWRHNRAGGCTNDGTSSAWT